MAYEKQGFATGQVLTANHLNHMEEGIAAAVTVNEMVAAIEEAITDAIGGSY